MKKYLLIGLMLIPALWMSAQEITGSWNGSLKLPGMQLRIVFHVNKTDAGYSVTMDSPDQSANGIPMTKATFENSILSLEMAAARIEYSGTLKNDTLFGTFNQAGQPFPVITSYSIHYTKLYEQLVVLSYSYFITKDFKIMSRITNIVKF